MNWLQKIITKLAVIAEDNEIAGVEEALKKLEDTVYADKGKRELLYSSPSLTHIAAMIGHLPLMKHLIEEGSVDIHITDTWERTALHYAAKRGNLKLVKYLIDQGADIKAKDKWDATVIHFAAESGNLKLVQYLVEEKGININDRVKFFDYTAMHLAAREGHYKIVRYLLNSITTNDINAKDVFLNTILHNAARSGNLKLVKYLLKENADINATDISDSTILHNAVKSGNIKLVKYLVEKQNMDINAADLFRKTPIYYAKKNGYLEIEKYLLSRDYRTIESKYNNTELIKQETIRLSKLKLSIELGILLLSITLAIIAYQFFPPAAFIPLLITPIFNIITNLCSNKLYPDERYRYPNKIKDVIWNTILPNRFCWVDRVAGAENKTNTKICR